MTSFKEIGSEFWTAEITAAYSKNTKTYLSGRTALTAIILDLKARGAKSVLLPAFCCQSMIEPFLRQGMKINFYPVWKNESRLTFSLEKVFGFDAVLLVNFFGFMSLEMQAAIEVCQNAGKITILDLTHAVFSDEKKYSADYLFGSYRKWTGIEGGFASGRFQDRLFSWEWNEIGSKYLMLRNEARLTKTEFVAGGYRDNRLREKHLALFEQAEDLLDREYLCDTDEKNKEQLNRLDSDYIIKKRRENAATIYTAFSQLERCLPVFSEYAADDVPLTVPILVMDGHRDSLRAFLRERGVFCPIHWPLSPLHKVEQETMKLYREELSLVCDQRYNVADMERMMEIVKQWEKTVFA